MPQESLAWLVATMLNAFVIMILVNFIPTQEHEFATSVMDGSLPYLTAITTYNTTYIGNLNA